ncbi:LysE family translocator [Robbsia sp. KACC 23696]|uniref:LysE family translocator n=1 Tax=Robbsia sp. KACC 23696 TaxID=3149231 RepID=UPI00325B15B0
MFGITHFSLFVLSCIALSVTPGPDSAFIVARSVSDGQRAGLASALGIITGCCVHLSLTVLGLAALLAASVQAFTIVKWVGAAYLIWLGIRMLITRQAARASATTSASPTADTRRGAAELMSVGATSPASPAVADRGAAVSVRRLFWQGFVTNLLNPKVVLFFVAFFPQFVEPGLGDKRLAFLALGLVFISISLVWNTGLAVVAGSLTRRVEANPQIKRWVDRAVGSLFVGLGVRLALVTR